MRDATGLPHGDEPVKPAVRGLPELVLPGIGAPAAADGLVAGVSAISVKKKAAPEGAAD